MTQKQHTRILSKGKLTAVASLALMLSYTSTNAAIKMQVTNVGTDLLITASGSINTSALTETSGSSAGSFIDSNMGILRTAPEGTGFQYWSGITGPSSFGTSGSLALAGTGDMIGLWADQGRIYLPNGYVSESLLSGSTTFNSTNIAALGLTEGIYTWNWGSGATADSFTVNISAVPEPANAALLIGCLATCLLTVRRKRSA